MNCHLLEQADNLFPLLIDPSSYLWMSETLNVGNMCMHLGNSNTYALSDSFFNIFHDRVFFNFNLLYVPFGNPKVHTLNCLLKNIAVVSSYRLLTCRTYLFSRVLALPSHVYPSCGHQMTIHFHSFTLLLVHLQGQPLHLDFFLAWYGMYPFT